MMVDLIRELPQVFFPVTRQWENTSEVAQRAQSRNHSLLVSPRSHRPVLCRMCQSLESEMITQKIDDCSCGSETTGNLFEQFVDAQEETRGIVEGPVLVLVHDADGVPREEGVDYGDTGEILPPLKHLRLGNLETFSCLPGSHKLTSPGPSYVREYNEFIHKLKHAYCES